METGATSLADAELLARLFRALGDASRQRILRFLEETGEAHQAEIVRGLGLSQARASEHLACLVWCGFLVPRVEGRRTYYRVNGPGVADILGRAQAFLGANQAAIASCRATDEEN